MDRGYPHTLREKLLFQATSDAYKFSSLPTMIKDWKSLHVNIKKSNSIHCLKKDTRLCPNAWVDCPLIFTYCYFHLFINLLISILVTVCETSLFRILQVMSVDVHETVIRNQIHIKKVNTPETKQQREKKGLPWHNNKLLKTGNLIQNKPLLSCQIF